ncbi:MAG: SDR family oxidoreductase [Flavobacteriaceae bacterium]|nr:SDR family oxidoreductase [Flavobacteriaceae bacterium]
MIQDSNYLFSVNNKVALVIGGRGKIGFEISCSLAKLGARVIVASRSVTKEQSISKSFKKSKIDDIVMDASNEEDVLKNVKLIEEKYGKIDILINSSSWRPMTKFMEDSIENWEESIKKNSSAFFIPSRIVGKKMAKINSGSIINISSIYGINAPPMSIYENCDFITEPDYPFLKAGCIGLSKYLSSYFAKNNVRVNVVAPGGVSNNQPIEFSNNYNNRVPMGRMANAEDIVGAVIFLASDASKYITGVVLPVDGGWTAV